MTMRRTIGSAGLSSILALGALAGATAAQDAVEIEDEATMDTMGTIVSQEEDGRTVYYLDPGDGELIELVYGPSWFWGELNPLDALVGTEVTIGGHLRDGMPDEHASETAQERAAKAPGIQVKSIDGEKHTGKPAWAGGPKVVGESHPGHKGWSKGQAAKAGGHASKPVKAAKPDTPHKPARAARPDKPNKP